MASTVPYVPNTTWADGSGGGTPVTAAKLNTIEQGLTDGHQMPAVRVFHSAAQSVNTATDTYLAFNSERFDQAGGTSATQHDTVTNNSRLIARYAGIYQITGNVNFAGNATGTRYAFIRINGTTRIASNMTTADATENPIVVTTLYQLAVNDYVELGVRQTSGGALNVQAAGNQSPEFMMIRVG